MDDQLPYVFVHGLFGQFDDPAVFSALAPAACSAPDLIGYGSEAPDIQVTTQGQVDALAAHVDSCHRSVPVNLVAHSIGAVYAFAFADAYPHRVASITSVEGNFSLADAFWSQSIAALEQETARKTIAQKLADPASFLLSDGMPITPALLRRAETALSFQPWQTVWQSARAVVATTAAPEYERQLRRVFARTRVFLMAGERSVSEWAVPQWATSSAQGLRVIAGVGHMMMLENPTAFGRTLRELTFSVRQVRGDQ